MKVLESYVNTQRAGLHVRISSSTDSPTSGDIHTRVNAGLTGNQPHVVERCVDADAADADLVHPPLREIIAYRNVLDAQV